MTGEKRRYRRLAVDISVGVRKEGTRTKGKTKAMLVKSRNFSQNGIYLMTPRTYRPGTKLDLDIYLAPRSSPIPAKAKVIWVANKKLQPTHYPGMAVEITKLNPENKKKIIAYLNQKLRNFRDAQELQAMYLALKTMAARLVELEERHKGAQHFKKVLDTAIGEIDQIAHIIDREVWEVRCL